MPRVVRGVFNVMADQYICVCAFMCVISRL